MISLGPLIVEEGLIVDRIPKTRQTARAIIINEENQLLMAYSKLFRDYTFSGGGLKSNEDFETALIRELQEEIGALDVEVIKPVGYTQELRYGIRGEADIYIQTSMYYLCKIHRFGDANLHDREVMHGLEPIWISMDDALMQNEFIIIDERHQTKGLKTVLVRENMVLKKLKEKALCEDLKLSLNLNT